MVTPSESGSILNQSLPYTKEITLTYKAEHFSIDFVSFDFLSPEKVKYSYILEGYDKKWYNIGTQHSVSYSNLPRGNYIFKVRSVNGAGIKSENEAELMIHINPAPWFSYLAWAIYVLLTAGNFLLYFQATHKNLCYKKIWKLNIWNI